MNVFDSKSLSPESLVHLHVWAFNSESCNEGSLGDEYLSLSFLLLLTNAGVTDKLLDKHSSLNRVQRVQLGEQLAGPNIDLKVILRVFLSSFRSVCVCTVDVWTAIWLLSASAIRFQSLSSIRLSWCGGGAPWGNVIIPCWPQSASFTALSVSGGMVAWGPYSLYHTAAVLLKACYSLEFLNPSSNVLLFISV